MNITKKIDRAVQWTAEKMGAEAKTNVSDDFRMLETEMALRYDGMDRLQKSMNAYVKWVGRREALEDKEKGLPVSYLGRTMASHGEDFEPDSEFGNCLITMGRANERVAAIQENFAADATTIWLESLERSLAMMKDYQTARKKLESRRLAVDASMNKVQKARRDDFRVEEELRMNKTKYEETNEDVVRRMQDIKDAEVDSVRNLTDFLNAELDFHERCAEELRRARDNWHGATVGAGNRTGGGYGVERRATGRNRAHSDRLSRTNSRNIYEVEEPEPESEPVRMPIRSNSRLNNSRPDVPARPPVNRANTFQGVAASDRPRGSGASTPLSGQHVPNVGALRAGLRPVSRIQTANANVFADDGDNTSDSGSPDWGERSVSSATSFGSSSRSTSALGTRKAPPPPPPSRSKKPPPPIPAKRELRY